MIQSLPVEAERCLAIGRVVVERGDENPVDDGPERAQNEPVQDGGHRPGEAAGLPDDSPYERDESDREEQEEHETGPEDAALMGAPTLPQEGAASTERLHGPDAFEDHRREDEQCGDRPSVAENPRDETSAPIVADRSETKQHADRRRQERPDEDLEEARVRRADAVQDVRPLALETDGRRTDDRRHEVHGEEVRHQVGDEDLLVQETARRRRGREAEGDDAQHHDQPDETGEDEREEREGHQARFRREDAEAPDGQVESASQLSPQSRLRSRLTVSLPTPLRRVHPASKKGEAGISLSPGLPVLTKEKVNQHVERETPLSGVLRRDEPDIGAPKIDWARGASDERPINRGSSLEPDGTAHDTARRCGDPSTRTEFRSFRPRRFPVSINAILCTDTTIRSAFYGESAHAASSLSLNGGADESFPFGPFD